MGNIPGGMMVTSPIDVTMDQAVNEGIFPGGVLLVASAGEIVHHAAYGFASLTPMQSPTTVETLYDLASLTKPLATTLAVMLLVQDQRLKLDEPLCHYLPRLKDMMVGQVTPRHLLSHTAGLPAWKPYYRLWNNEDVYKMSEIECRKTRHRIYDLVHCEILLAPVGKEVIYSDLGFILLAELVEHISTANLAEFCLAQIFVPLATPNTFFVAPSGPVCVTAHKERTYAATEDDPWRRRILVGEVHDENAYVLGGVAGHAGLFSTAADVFRIVQEYVRATEGKGRILREDLAQLCVARQDQALDSTRALGWDVPSNNSSSGKHFSEQSFGHLGFTGTSVWADPKADLVVVLLTNRVHPHRTNNRIAEFRPLLHDAIYEQCAKL